MPSARSRARSTDDGSTTGSQRRTETWWLTSTLSRDLELGSSVAVDRLVRRRHGRDLRLAGLVALLVAGACKSDPASPPAAPGSAAPRDAGGDARAGGPDAGVAPPSPWARLAAFPVATAVRVVPLPARSDMPRFEVGGPVVAGDVAVVSSSQFGFVAVDWRRGQIAWAKPAGLHVAPPIARGGTAILLGDCIDPPGLADTLLGCLRVVAASGADESYAWIHGSHLEAFAAAHGTQDVWLDGDRGVRWRRGDQAVAIDLITGAARKASSAPPVLHVVDGSRSWDITRTKQRIIARQRGKLAWQTDHAYDGLLGAVYLADLSPMIRVLRIGAYAGLPELNLLDIDATGSLHGQASFPVPAIATIGEAIDGVGNTALAVRLDVSLRRDFIAAYAATAKLMYVYRLPEVPRAEPVGLAIVPGGVLVFHDGDTFTVLPDLSSPPTVPGSPDVASQNSTP